MVFGSRLLAAHLLAAFAAASGLFATPRCAGQFVGLGQAANYGLFETGSSKLTVGTGSAGTTNAGIANGGTFMGSGGSFTGSLNFAASSGSSGSTTFSQGVNTGVTNVTSAVSDASTALTSLAAQGAGTSITSNSITGSALQNVFTASSGLTLSSNFTINGPANATFIINLGNNFMVTGSASIVLSGGVTANHVIWDVANHDTTISSSGTFNGTIITNSHNITVSNGTLNGALIAGGNMSFSGATINQTPFQAIPEPGSLLLGSLLAGLCGTVHYYRRRRAAS